MEKLWRRIVSLVLVFAMCCCILPTGVLATEITTTVAEEESDGAAFGEGLCGGETASIKEAWRNDAVSTSTMKKLLNSIELHPQKTGWDKLDALLEKMLSAYEGEDTYTKLRGMYDWLVKNVTYSWEGYSYTAASVKAYNSVTGYNYLKNMTYEDGLEKSIPDDMANRTYHILYAKKGVCYDYAIAFAVIARYIGIDSYVITGRFTFEDTSNGAGHHGWAVLVLDGAEYIFDPQRDARNYQYHRNNGYYFGIASGNTYRYKPNYWSADTKANAARKASMLSVTADRAHKVTVTAEADSGGSVSGGGSYITGNTATLTATADSGVTFAGWYDSDGNLVSSSKSYTFTVTDAVTLKAKFAYTVTAKAGSGGSVSGGGNYIIGNTATLTATADNGATFVGWYDSDGNLVSSSESYTFTVTKAVTLKAKFAYTVTAVASRSGNVSGAGTCIVGKSITLKASSDSGAKFSGWYDTSGNLLSTSKTYKFTPTANTTVYALFKGDIFCDMPAKSWYLSYVTEGVERGLVKGTTAVTFSPETGYTRGMAVVMLARLEGADTSAAAASPFTDIGTNRYYTAAVNWAYENGIVKGRSNTSFDPDASITREEFLTIVDRYLQWKGYDLEESELTYSDADAISAFALSGVKKAQSISLITGYVDGTLRPGNILTRSEGVVVIVRLARYLENNPVPEIVEEEETEEAEETQETEVTEEAEETLETEELQKSEDTEEVLEFEEAQEDEDVADAETIVDQLEEDELNAEAETA